MNSFFIISPSYFHPLRCYDYLHDPCGVVEYIHYISNESSTTFLEEHDEEISKIIDKNPGYVGRIITVEQSAYAPKGDASGGMY